MKIILPRKEVSTEPGAVQDRQVSPASRREVVLDLTDAGVSTGARVTQQRRREIARIVNRMPERQRSALGEASARPAASHRWSRPLRRLDLTASW